MSSFKRKGNKIREDVMLSEYVELVLAAKEATANLEAMKPLVMPIVKARGGHVFVDGYNIDIGSRPKLLFYDALEAELRKLQDQSDFLKIKMNRAKEDNNYTVLSEGEYLVCKAAKEA